MMNFNRPFQAILFLVLLTPITAAAGQEVAVSLEGIRAYHKIDDSLSTSGQISQDQIRAIREAGFAVVVNLAPPDEDRNKLEGFWVVQEGMTYVQIPVSWQEPELQHLQMFFDLMDANRARKVYVHCFANMRVSAFIFLYRTLRQNVPEEEALRDLHSIWDPAEHPQWAEFIDAAKRKNFSP